ncbi:MAG: hypothetical protein A2506_07780 [Elusimicrobia bacterium RIFOXYD12_FULL_66_9]|nr:MAG: hypothetical protein A2506_07780 [Elusimicrobia bacterium RIFOXYD12_FULL_66_9]
MRNALLLASLAAAGSASAAGIESLRNFAEQDFLQAPLIVLPSQTPEEPILQAPLKPTPLHSSFTSGAELGRVNLAAQLDRNLSLMNRVFGARALDMGVATDAAFSKFYLTFSDAKTTVLAALGDLNRLRGSGVDARIDARTVYNFRVKANIFNPARGSTLKMSPTAGTAGPAHDMKTGAVLDAAHARAALFSANGKEFWVFYGRQVLPDASGFAEARSFLFVHEAGLSSKAWPLAEAALKPGTPSGVDLGGTRVSLTRTPDGFLIVRAAP